MNKSHDATGVSTSMAVAVSPNDGSADFRPEDLLCRVRNEYREMPGLRLTLDQAQRLWQIRRGECQTLLNALVDSGFLARTSAGAFVKR
jgi:hypothetical protein